MNDNTRRSTTAIRAELLRRAFDGESKRSPEQMEALIMEREVAASIMPAEHAAILQELESKQFNKDEIRWALGHNLIIEILIKEQKQAETEGRKPRRDLDLRPLTGKDPKPE